MQSIRPEEKQNFMSETNNSMTIDFFRYIKIERDNLQELEKAEKEFFPHTTSSHECCKKDNNGLYHHQYQFSFPIKHQRFYIELRYTTESNKPAEESFSQAHNSTVPQITIEGIHFVNFLKQHLLKSANMLILTQIDNFLYAYHLALEKSNKRGIFSCLSIRSASDQSIHYVDQIDANQKLRLNKVGHK